MMTSVLVCAQQSCAREKGLVDRRERERERADCRLSQIKLYSSSWEAQRRRKLFFFALTARKGQPLGSGRLDLERAVLLMTLAAAAAVHFIVGLLHCRTKRRNK